MKSVVVLQPSYIPWRGYFDQIRKADLFVFYDDVQYDKGGWRNRNRIKSPNGLVWLTIPVELRKAASGRRPNINEIRIAQAGNWKRKHLTSIEQSYAGAPFLDHYRDLLAEFYSRDTDRLSDFVIGLTVGISHELGLQTEFLRSSELHCSGRKTDRLLEVLQKTGATHYISGPSARAYLDEQQLLDAGITLEYMQYDYPVYEQLHPPYEPSVSVIDLMLMKGPQSVEYIRGTQELHKAVSPSVAGRSSGSETE